MNKAVFFDRDGTLTRDHGYTFRVDDLVWLDGALDAVRLAHGRGYRVIVVTNQSGIGRGYFTEAEMHAFHGAMRVAVEKAGGAIDAFYFCPFHEDSAVDQYRVADHPDRKPNPGMLLRAMADFQLYPAACLMVGDLESDLEAGRRAGVQSVRADGRALDAVIGPYLSSN